MARAEAKNQFGKRHFRRRWITWTRMVRYGVNNFTRNAWLTTAATAVMTITLLIIFTAFIARGVLNDTVNEIRQKVDIPINLRSDVTQREVQEVTDRIKSLDNVVEVRYTSLEESKAAYIRDNKPSPEQLQIIAELPTTPFFPILHVVVKDPNNTTGLARLVAEDSLVKNALNQDPRRAPAFTGEKKKVIETISSWASLAERIGLIAGAIFVAISMLIIFNTIRMAIFNRRDEIEMMKLIGADKSFIRGPFVVEGVMYGFFAAIAATIIGVLAFIQIEPKMREYGIATSELHTNVVTLVPLILISMIAIGALIGIISSRLAVRRYLKV